MPVGVGMTRSREHLHLIVSAIKAEGAVVTGIEPTGGGHRKILFVVGGHPGVVFTKLHPRPSQGPQGDCRGSPCCPPYCRSTVMTYLIGLLVKLPTACRCGSTIAAVESGRGPHVAGLRCDCGRHVGWVSRDAYEFLNFDDAVAF
jgi:hypothetical protein